jgi:hypothetical protein
MFLKAYGRYKDTGGTIVTALQSDWYGGGYCTTKLINVRYLNSCDRGWVLVLVSLMVIF